MHRPSYALLLVLGFSFASSALSQSTLTLSSNSGLTGATVPLTLTLGNTAGGRPGSLQFTLQYDPLDFTSVNVSSGAETLAAGKSISCYPASAGQTMCLVFGINSTTLGNGVVASVNVTVGASSSSTSRNIQIAAVLGASATGTPLPITGTGGTVTVTAPPLPATLTSLGCSPSTLTSGAASTCTITLSKAATSNTAVTLADNSANLSVPASVTVASGQSTATFSATAGTLTVNGSAIVTATLSGTSRTATITLNAPVTLTSLACSPSTLTSGAASTCTVTLSKAATSNTAVTLADNSANLSVPASVTVASGQSTATFTATAGTLTVDGSAIVTATLSGTSRTATITLNAAASLTSLVCSPSTLASGAASTCTVTLSKAASSNAAVTISDNSTSLAVPASVTVSSGQSTATFSATAGTLTVDGSAIVTATLSGTSRTATITLNAPVTLTSLACSPSTLTSGASSTCTITLSKAATSNAAVTISDNSPSLTVPASVTVSSGQSSATFTATAGTLSADGSALITAAYNGVSQTFSIILAAPQNLSVSSLTCRPQFIFSGQTTRCTVAMAATSTSDATAAISVSSSVLAAPSIVVIRAGQLSAEFFAVGTSPSSTTVRVTAMLGTTSKSYYVVILKSTFSLETPDSPSATEGDSIDFTVKASDAEDLAVHLSSSHLPAGSSFDPSSGRFFWNTSGAAPGSYPVTFHAINTIGETTAAEVTLEVMPIEPVLTKLLHAATRESKNVCSPGSLASIEGASLHRDGEPTQVFVNAQSVPLLHSSLKRIVFQCPDVPAGSPLTIQIQRGERLSNVLDSTMQDAAPGVFSLYETGKGQGLVFLRDTNQVVMHRNPQFESQPAMQADRVTILTTGLGRQPAAEWMNVVIGQNSVPVDSVHFIGQGLWQVIATIPRQPANDAVPVYLTIRATDGSQLTSNLVSIAVEGSDTH